mmetsp:Transcript_3912/g.7905  ORF Transcript_3912/g.7905 Transcript_3912/m.7905 type:complete len:338 (+) Transcript_3912:98-1111(+)
MQLEQKQQQQHKGVSPCWYGCCFSYPDVHQSLSTLWMRSSSALIVENRVFRPRFVYAHLNADTTRQMSRIVSKSGHFLAQQNLYSCSAPTASVVPMLSCKAMATRPRSTNPAQAQSTMHEMLFCIWACALGNMTSHTAKPSSPTVNWPLLITMPRAREAHPAGLQPRANEARKAEIPAKRMEASGINATALGLPVQLERGSLAANISHIMQAVVQPDSALRAPAIASTVSPISPGTQVHPNHLAPALQPDGVQRDVRSGNAPNLLQSAMDPSAQDMFLVRVAKLQVPVQLPQSRARHRQPPTPTQLRTVHLLTWSAGSDTQPLVRRLPTVPRYISAA